MGGMVYRFKVGAHLPAGLSPQEVGERLARLREEGGGFLPASVVEDARSEHSPLHPAFEWDDGEAAERYRLEQAGHLIRCVVVVVRDEHDNPHETRAFVPVSVREAGESRYLPIVTVISDEDYKRQHTERLLNELLAIRRKGTEFHEFDRIWRAIDQAVKRFAA